MIPIKDISSSSYTWVQFLNWTCVRSRSGVVVRILIWVPLYYVVVLVVAVLSAAVRPTLWYGHYGVTRACDGPFQFTGHERTTRLASRPICFSSIIESTSVGESTWRNKIIHICSIVNLACYNNKISRFPLLSKNKFIFRLASKVLV